MDVKEIAGRLCSLERERLTGWQGPGGAAYNAISEGLREVPWRGADWSACSPDYDAWTGDDGQWEEASHLQGTDRMRRIDRDVDPDTVARHVVAQAAWAAQLGHPKRCKTNLVHPGLGCCLFCGAEMGVSCRGESR